MREQVGGAVTGERFDVRIGRQRVGLCHVGPVTSTCTPAGDVALGAVVLRRAVGADRTLWEWHEAARESRRAHRTVSVALLSDAGAPVVAWRLERCWPLRWSGPTLDTLLPAVACEELEITFDRVVWSSEGS